MLETICFAEKKDIPLIADMISEAYRQIKNPDWFYGDDTETLKRHAEKEGFILKAVADGEIAAFLMIRYPKAAEDNLGSYLGLPPEEKNLVAHMETVVVRKEYRGRGLQKKLMQEGERQLAQKGYKYLMGTAHPDNVYSVNNFLKLGYEIVAEDMKYGGLRRYIFCRIQGADITAPIFKSEKQKPAMLLHYE